MSLFDLKPLTDATILELGLETHELWQLKIGNETFGPFETLSLRHYAHDNKRQFEGAFATHMDKEEWHSFEELQEFQDIFAEVVVEEDENKERQYWVLNQGQLSNPHSYDAIEKKIEMGLLSLTDVVSTDEGETWHKVFQMQDFAHKLHSSVELPRCPSENSFQEAKEKVLQKIEEKAQSGGKDLSGLAYLGQKTTQIVVLKIDEINIESLQETEISRSLKWAVPSAAVGMVAMLMCGFFFFGENEESFKITDNDVQLKRSISGSRSGLLEDTSKRMPSSVRRPLRSQRSGLTRNTYQQSSYPTHIETHQEPDDRGNDPQHEAIFDQDQPQPQTEESLVQNQATQNMDPSLDATMNGGNAVTEQPLEQPQVEEVSDF